MTPSKLVKLPTFQRNLLLPSSGSKKYSWLQFTNPHGIIGHNISIFNPSALLSGLIVPSYYNLRLRYLVAWRAVVQDPQQHPAFISRCSSQRLLPSRVQYVITQRTKMWLLLPLKPPIVYSTYKCSCPSLALFHILRL
jgi:hypothetical protein